jgi:hypothetical protein
MDFADLPEPLRALLEVLAPAIHQVYDANAERHDELSGDDAMVFGIAVYRNSWFRVEQEVRELDGWKTARPDGSLLISGHGYRLHMYRFGNDELVDLDLFRIDEQTASATKRHVADTNRQLRFGYNDSDEELSASEYRDLLIVHAGNPVDGCCGIWLGAPLAANERLSDIWAWTIPVWVVERAESVGSAGAETRGQVPHDELAEPVIDITAVEVDTPETGEA